MEKNNIRRNMIILPSTENGSSVLQNKHASSDRLKNYSLFNRFGFLRDSPYGSLHVSSPMVQVTPVQCRANDYVHTSGVAFVRIPHLEEDGDAFSFGLYRPEMKEPCNGTWGFYWMPNYMLTKRWRSSATGDKGAGSKLRSEFEDFCADKNGVLKEFWESCKEAAGFQGGIDEEETVSAAREEKKERDECYREEVSDSQEMEDSGSSTFLRD